MKEKQVSSILMFSLLALVVCNNVKAAESNETQSFVKTEMYNDSIEKNMVLLLKTGEALEDCKSSKGQTLTALTEYKQRKIMQENQLQKAVERWRKSEENLKQSEELVDAIRGKCTELNIQYIGSKYLLAEYKKLGTPSEIEQALVKLKHFEILVDNKDEGKRTQVISDIQQLKQDVTQLKNEHFNSRQTLGNNLEETEQDNSALSKKYRNLQLKHELLKHEHQKSDTEIEEQD